MSDIVCFCRRCGRHIETPDVIRAIVDESTAKFAASNLVCEKCSEQVRHESELAERDLDLAERRAALDDKYQDRITESGLDTYALTFDPNHPEANRALMNWVTAHVDSCMWIVGRSGLCKTRCIQAAARIAAHERTVRYWPVMDLAARLTETAKKPEAFLWDIYKADLLILEDLGKEPLTAARLASLSAIVDRRYAGWDQARRLQGGDDPHFWLWFGTGKLGGQIWITSQMEPDALVAKLSAVDQYDASAIVRRLSEMCVLHRAEVVR